MNRRFPEVSATLRLRTDQLAKYRAVAGLNTDTALAERMGIDPSTVSRVLRGEQSPGVKFIPGVVSAFKGLTLDDLWEVVANDTESGAAA